MLISKLKNVFRPMFLAKKAGKKANFSLFLVVFYLLLANFKGNLAFRDMFLAKKSRFWIAGGANFANFKT